MAEREGRKFFFLLQRMLAALFLIVGVAIVIETVFWQYAIAFAIIAVMTNKPGLVFFILAVPYAATATYLRPSFGAAQMSEREGSKFFFLLQAMLAALFLILGVALATQTASHVGGIGEVVVTVMTGGLGLAYFILAALSSATAKHLRAVKPATRDTA